MNRLSSALAIFILLAVCQPAGAWTNHALGTWQALDVMPEIARANAIPAESLEAFLASESQALVPVLATEEEWARAHVVTYPARPGALAFSGSARTSAELRAAFLRALRINPEARLALYLQLRPGQELAGRTRLPDEAITVLKHNASTHYNVFVPLVPGQQVAVLDVIASASDEPDYGLDINLWSDNGTPYGRDYGFGKQPFGNPAYEFATQAPMHMGFFHESAIVYKAAPFLQRTYGEYRIHLYQTLARFAFQSGHPYWGWRFTGWALHYLQDLTQPYHARVLPGVGVASMLWINTLDIVGLHDQKTRAVALVSDRHLALENYQLHWLRQDYLDAHPDDSLMKALRDTRSDSGVHYGDRSPRDVISAAAAARADATDSALVAGLPPRYTQDPAYVVGETEPDLDLYAVSRTMTPAQQERLAAALIPLMTQFGVHTRSFVRTVLPVSAPPPSANSSSMPSAARASS